MGYYKTHDNVKIRVTGDDAFAKFSDGKEVKMSHPSTTVTDAIIENNKITKEEYEK